MSILYRNTALYRAPVNLNEKFSLNKTAMSLVGIHQNGNVNGQQLSIFYYQADSKLHYVTQLFLMILLLNDG